MVDESFIWTTLANHFHIRNYEGESVDIDINSAGCLDVVNGDVMMFKPGAGGHIPLCWNSVGGDFIANHMSIRRLANAPRVCDSLNVNRNLIEDLGECPEKLSKLLIRSNRLKNFQGTLATVELIDAVDNPFLDLEGLENISVDMLKITWRRDLPLLRSLTVRKWVKLYQEDGIREKTGVGEIINRYIGQGEAGAFECGAELASAGFKENARW